jgi:hypothetical protein
MTFHRETPTSKLSVHVHASHPYAKTSQPVDVSLPKI